MLDDHFLWHQHEHCLLSLCLELYGSNVSLTSFFFNSSPSPLTFFFSSSPSPCSAGTYSLAGSTSCTACPAGYRCPNASANPEACSAGTYSLGSQTSCTECPAGQACPSITTATDAYSCVAGRVLLSVLHFFFLTHFFSFFFFFFQSLKLKVWFSTWRLPCSAGRPGHGKTSSSPESSPARTDTWRCCVTFFPLSFQSFKWKVYFFVVQAAQKFPFSQCL